MSRGFEAVKISEHVYWVGAIDWKLRNFHGYETSRGSTYNAFLIIADRVTLIDAVKPNFYDEMMDRISSVIDPSQIDIIVSNHAEMDHSGSLPRLIDEVKPSKIVASAKGVQALYEHFRWDVNVETVKTGDTLDIGTGTLKFIETRMIHWPDSMFAFFDKDNILFSNDAFGMHLATGERFADEISPYILDYEAAKYYANIILHLSPMVKRLLETLPTYNLDIKMIAPDHGPVWREDINFILERYSKWVEQKPTDKAVIVYDTMWESTSKMAAAVADGLVSAGAHVKILPLDGVHRSDVITEVLDAGALIVGSPTINNQIYPTVADVMNYLKGLKPKNLIGASFGSYGWSGEAVKHLDEILEEMGVELVSPGTRIKYVPSDDNLVTMRELGVTIGKKLALLK
ncbi:MAG: FprA family A-type flavoprotein [Deltaproteobacteria bacterium]|nr:FprA family A-type flavoprotein [Deltaproteobacteria bacterium]